MSRLLLAATVHQTFDAFLVPYAEHFRRRGWRVDLMAAGAPDCTTCSEATDTTMSAAWSRRPTARGNVRQVQEVRRTVAANRYDLVHVHTPVASFLTRLALRPPRHRGRPGPAVVYTAHGFHRDEQHRWRTRPLEVLEQRAGRWTDHLIVMNDEDHDWARRHRVVPPGSLDHLPGIGVDLGHYAPTRSLVRAAAAVRAQLGAAPDVPLFAMAAEFIPRKRHRTLVEALDLLDRLPATSDRGPAHVVFLGEGPLQDEVEQQAHALGLSDRCHFLGQCADVRPHLLAAQALVLPSTREGLPRCVLEAMAMSVPVIATDIRGTRALVGEGRGHLVEVDHPDQLAHAMAAVLDAPDEAARRARRAAATSHRYDIKHLLRCHDDVYDRLLDRTKVPT